MYNLHVNPQQGIVTRFLVNGIQADQDHFCSEDDRTGRLIPKKPNHAVITQYQIDEYEFHQIAKELASKTSFHCVNCD